MTNEQAIKILRANVMVACDTSDKVGYGTPLNKAIEEALNMAIKALEQQPGDDCVSRQETLNAIIKELCIKDESYLLQSEKVIYNVVKNMPPVTMEINTGRRNGKTYEYYSKTMYKDKSLLEWAIIWLKTSNDTFFKEYGFNFNPHEYKGLYELAMQCRDNPHIGAIDCTQNLTTMATQLQSGLNNLQYGV